MQEMHFFLFLKNFIQMQRVYVRESVATQEKLSNTRKEIH